MMYTCSLCDDFSFYFIFIYIPQVGTLDSLMSLSDDLVRIDMLVENMVKKIEKQYQEVAGDQDPLKVNQTGGVLSILKLLICSLLTIN